MEFGKSDGVISTIFIDLLLDFECEVLRFVFGAFLLSQTRMSLNISISHDSNAWIREL